jgi:hypothetical protein
MMPLSEHEKDVLAQIERDLHEDDPQFADRIGEGRAASRCRLVLGALAVVCGFLVLLAGASLHAEALGVAGFVIMVAGGHIASLGVRPQQFRYGRSRRDLPGRSQHI